MEKVTARVQYSEYCVTEHRGARIALRLVYNIAMVLHDYILSTVSQELLDEISLELLKKKVSATQEHVHEAFYELGNPMQDVVSEAESRC